MEPHTAEPAVSPHDDSARSGTCPVCHLPVLAEYYFCPNCGASLHPAPLSTSAETQMKLYAHSIFLPMILFLSISKWKGYTYFKSEDPKAKQIGIIALVLLLLSTLLTFWFAYVWTLAQVQSSVNSINADMSI